jgi:hypothetical protein
VRSAKFTDGVVGKQVKTDKSVDFVGTERHLLKTLTGQKKRAGHKFIIRICSSKKIAVVYTA